MSRVGVEVFCSQSASLDAHHANLHELFDISITCSDHTVHSSSDTVVVFLGEPEKIDEGLAWLVNQSVNVKRNN